MGPAGSYWQSLSAAGLAESALQHKLPRCKHCDLAYLFDQPRKFIPGRVPKASQATLACRLETC
jgi:hypothetical protein